MFTMKAPAGQRIVHCNETQANILRKVGWTEVPAEDLVTERVTPIISAIKSVAPAAEVVNYYVEEMGASPLDVTLEPEPVSDPDTITVKPKRKYTRRVVSVDEHGNAHYKKKPRRQYRRRDMTAED